MSGKNESGVSTRVRKWCGVLESTGEESEECNMLKAHRYNRVKWNSKEEMARKRKFEDRLSFFCPF